MRRMKPNDVIEFFGTQQKAAVALSLTQSAVAHWVKAGEIPLVRQAHIQLVTNGQLVADQVTSA